MKHFILASIVAFGFASCSDPDNPDSPQNNSVSSEMARVEASFGNSFLQPVTNTTGKNVT